MKKKIKRRITSWVIGLAVTFIVTKITDWLFKADRSS